MTVVVDPSQGGIAQGIAQLGAALASRIGVEAERERELQRNPQMLQQLVPAARAASRTEGGMAGFARALGVREEFAQGLLNIAPTGAQALEESFLLGGGAEAQAASQILEAVLRGENAQAALDQNLPLLQSIAQARGAEFDAENAEVQSGLLNLRVENGVLSGQVDVERAQQQFDLQRMGFEADALSGFQTILDGLTPGSFEHTLAISGLANPNFASALVSMRNADLSAQLRALAAGQEMSPPGS
jgi:hypothetical protein